MGAAPAPLDQELETVAAEAIPAMSALTADYRRTAHRVPERPLKGLDAMVNWCIGRYERRGQRLQSLGKQAQSVEDFGKQFSELKDRDLQDRLLSFREEVRREPTPANDTL